VAEHRDAGVLVQPRLEHLAHIGRGDGLAAPVDGAFGDDDDAYIGRDDLGPLLAAFDAALARTAEGVAAGEFPFAAKRDQAVACAECGARGICRERYALRFGAAGGGGRERAGGGRP